MAVDVQTLTEAQRPLEERIVEFLEANPQTAFNAFDVYAALEGLSTEASAILGLVYLTRRQPPPGFADCKEKLEALAKQGRIVAAEYRGTRHFHARTT